MKVTEREGGTTSTKEEKGRKERRAAEETTAQELTAWLCMKSGRYSRSRRL